MAESAYVRCKDYPGILFTKTLGKIQNEAVKKAEVAAWFKNFDEVFFLRKIHLKFLQKT